LVRFRERSWRRGVPLALEDIDFTGATPEKGILHSRFSTLEAIRPALEAAGIEFLSLRENNEGIRVRSPPRADFNVMPPHSRAPKVLYTAMSATTAPSEA
jgi:hypothetical protein